MTQRGDRLNQSSDDSPFSGYGKALRSAGPLFGAGIQLAAAIILMFFLGRWLDSKFDTSPWLMLVGIVFGLGAGMFNFIKLVSTLDDKRGSASAGSNRRASR